ncbi:SMP-30/gluconolactonase/LRE family protein [Gilvimarinus polysaccharolyticus]|uniref:SMP-30/gluconolactonase/LRE family protein n=1 Tax=Gilvimarinus polysaccharolyticus TaxID=863921 RepID=UPI000A00D59E|nr:SMP-30/gluconolactonase/LRE family protein [Gilvimarinus polysaccharolyticus]
MQKLLCSVGLILSATACTQSPTQNITEAQAVRASHYCAVAADYQAPAGTLKAARIAAADFSEPGLYEGPVWTNGKLLFSRFGFEAGFPSNILSYDGQRVSMALADAGSNGLALDNANQLLAGTHKYKAVARFDLNGAARKDLAREYRDNRFNSPNDLTMSSRGDVYFTDPDFQRAAAPGGQDATRVYRIDGTGQVSVVDDSIANPNGISLSPDEQTLYVAGGGEQGFIRAYPLNQGEAGAGRTFLADVTVPDGMAVDCLGNIYVTEHTKQQVRVISPEGDEIAVIKVDANVTNGAFGGEDGKTLYLTGAGALWSINLDVAGLPY